MLTWVEIRDAVLMALSSIGANKFRAALTMLGVMVGVSSVIALASVIDGLALSVEREIENLGSNVIYVTKYPPDIDWEEMPEEMRHRKPITVKEARAIRDECPAVDGVAPQNYYFRPGGSEAKYRNRKMTDARLFGTWPDYVKVRNRNLTEGRFLTDVDERFRLMNCVIGSQVARALFGDRSAVGREIRVNGYKFTVVGVLEELKSNFGNDQENRVVAIPLSTFSKLYPWEEELLLIARARSYKEIETAKEEITAALRRQRKVPFNKPDDFALSTQDQFREQVGNITRVIYIAMMVITSVGLLVGGIGVMNIMLVSVTERTREIGVRKAIGAKRVNILLQFLTEATTLSGAGGMIGILFGIAIGLGLNSLLGLPTVLSMVWILVGFTVAVSVGLVSGLYPAFKASRLDPIDALRYE